MARLAAGVKPTPHLERLKTYRANLVLAGGRRIIVDVEQEAAQSLKKIMDSGGLTIKQAITASLVNYAKSSEKASSKAAAKASTKLLANAPASAPPVRQ